jgi:subtilisin
VTARVGVRLSLFVFLFLGLGIWGGSRAAAAPPVEGEAYIIVLKNTVNANSAVPDVAKAHGLEVRLQYGHALKGMAAVVPPGRLAALQNDPRVAYVEPDVEVTIAAQSMPTGIPRIFADTNPNIGIDGNDDYRVDVDVAVLDTGVDFQHPDLNVVGGINCVLISRLGCTAGGDDDHYHGTHVAGTIAAIDNGTGVVGVAPGARIWAVKVLNAQGSGSLSTVIGGIDWVTANAATIEVANMSLGGFGYSQAEYDAIQAAVNAGVAFAVSAGNSAANAALYSPASFNNVLTTSALADFDGLPGGLGAQTCRVDVDDTLADFSNWGAAVDIAAPGVCILSTYPIEQGSYGTISGTSMASPHVAGALALLASANNPGNAANVFDLYNQVKNAGNFNWVDDSGDGIKEPLLDLSNHSLFNPVLIPTDGGGDPTPTPLPPTPTPSPSPTPPAPTPTPQPGDITLSAVGYKTRGGLTADLTWSGANGASVDIYRSGAVVATTENDGFYTDATGMRGSGSATYQVCEAGTSTCSNVVTVNW